MTRLFLLLLMVLVFGCGKECKKELGWGPVKPKSMEIVVAQFDCRGYAGKYWENPSWVGKAWTGHGMSYAMNLHKEVVANDWICEEEYFEHGGVHKEGLYLLCSLPASLQDPDYRGSVQKIAHLCGGRDWPENPCK